VTDLLSLVAPNGPQAPETFNVIAYGHPGSGKSTFAATAPGPILWLNLEGPGALAYARKTAASRGTQILEVRADKNVDVIAVLDQVYLHVHNRKDPQPQTVVVDTLGKLRDAILRQLAGTGRPSLPQFGIAADKIGNFVRVMRDENVNLVLLAHADVQDSDEGERLVRPLIGGKLTDTLPAEVDVLTYCAAVRGEDGVSYVGQLVEARHRVAKDRSGGLGATRPLDLTEWLAAYRAALTPDDSDLPFGLSDGPTLEDAIDAGDVTTEAA
jgi:hypothetical protein